MLKNVRSVLKWLSVAMIGPSVFSLFVVLSDLGSRGAPIVGILGFASAMISFALEDDKDINANGRAGFHGIWCTASVVLLLIFKLTGVSIAITNTTLLIAIVVWALTGIDFISEKISEFVAKRRQKEDENREAEHQAFIDRINNLIGDLPQTKALLLAIERLTPYAKEEADHILGALSRDAERYVMLRSLETTSSNEILVKTSAAEADEIAAAARALCADSTEMALTLLHEYQEVEAELRLGGNGQRGSELVRAHADFKRYLDGLREVSRSTDDAEANLREEIEALKPQPELQISSPANGGARKKLRSRN